MTNKERAKNIVDFMRFDSTKFVGVLAEAMDDAASVASCSATERAVVIVEQLALLLDDYGWPKAATKYALQAARKIKGDTDSLSWKKLDKELERMKDAIRGEKKE